MNLTQKDFASPPANRCESRRSVRVSAVPKVAKNLESAMRPAAVFMEPKQKPKCNKMLFRCPEKQEKQKGSVGKQEDKNVDPEGKHEGNVNESKPTVDENKKQIPNLTVTFLFVRV